MKRLNEAGLSAADKEAAIAFAAKEGKFEKRKKVTFQGREVYQWEQDMEEVHIFVQPPKGVTAKQIHCVIEPTHLKLGLSNLTRGSAMPQWYIDEDTFSLVDVSQSLWMWEDEGVVHIQLQKSHVAETWLSALRGRGAGDSSSSSSSQPAGNSSSTNNDSASSSSNTSGGTLNEIDQQRVKQQMLLERFQKEHPQFDFSGASFSGAAPDPRKFMGGLDHTKM